MPKNPSVTVTVPNRTLDDKSHHNRLTQLPGALVPILVDELIPGTRVDCSMTLAASLPPLASDTYMRVKYKVEAFFCPLRLCTPSFEPWFVQRLENVLDMEVFDLSTYAACLPSAKLPTLNPMSINRSNVAAHGTVDVFAPGTLLDYLGLKSSDVAMSCDTPISFWPAVAYHLIWQHWYRSPLVQRECFASPWLETIGSINPVANNSEYLASILPYWKNFTSNFVAVMNVSNKNAFRLADNVSLWELRYRNYGFDYFTNCFPTNSQPSMNVTVSGGSFSIASLRASNSYQQFLELMQLAGNRMVDSVKARYGADLSDGVAQRPILLGSCDYDVYSRGVSVTATNSGFGNNPFENSAGARVGNAFASGTDKIIDGFEVKEPGYIFVIGSLVPIATYGSGTRRYLTRYTSAGGTSADLAEMANPMLQNTGNEPVYQFEVSSGVTSMSAVFGYSDRYMSWRDYPSEIHGMFMDGKSLQSFVLQRYFDQPTTLNSAFLEIPANCMDDVTVVTSALSDYGALVDIDFDYRTLVPLFEHSMPSLQNPAYEHGKPITIHRGGFRF